MKTTSKRLGIFGGTFNPPHLGHLVIAEQARIQADLDRVVFVPAFQPPHKVGTGIVHPRHRLNMVRLAIRGNRQFSVSDIEIKEQGISYTVRTLELLKAQNPGAELFLILGSDSLRDFPSWKSPDAIRGLAELVVYPRRGFELSGADSRTALMLKSPVIGISSTELRMSIIRGESIRYLVPAPVEQYIRRHHLYVGPGLKS